MLTLTFRLALLFAVVAPAYTTSFHRRQSGVTSNCNHDFAFSWDDGPYLWTEEIVDEFDCLGGKTTFFVNGNYESCIYSQENVQRLRYAFEAGHQIASHSWSHADFSNLSEEQIDIEIGRLDNALVNILGVRPRFFRAPNGSISPSVASYIHTKHGKIVVSSDVDAGDDDPNTSIEDIYQFYGNLASQGAGSPHLALSHENSAAALDALDMGSAELLGDAGVQLITVAECLDMAPYDIVGEFGTRDSSWTCSGDWSPPTAPSCVQTYSATADDKTCDTVAAKFGVTAADIFYANPNWLNCGDIWEYTPICIPAPVSQPEIQCAQTYTAEQGDTCASIGSRFDLSAEDILAANDHLSCDDIWEWTPICVPDISYPSTSTTSTSTSMTSTSTMSSSTSTSTTTSASDPCVSTYSSVDGDTCDSIGQMFGLTGAEILAANDYLTCSDIWASTPICIPNTSYPSMSTTSTSTSMTSSTMSSSTSTTTSASDPCVSTYSSVDGDTCDSIGQMFGLTGAEILAANNYLTCSDIWASTPICIPPSGSSTSTSTSSSTSPTPSCVTTYAAGDNETCISIAIKFGLSATEIYESNSFLSCDAIWKYTPICIPPGGRGCTNTISSWPGANCVDIAQAYGTTAENIQFWNDWLNCDDIWTNTSVCVSH